MSFTLKLLILSGVLWLSAISFIIYAWISYSRQRLVLRYIANRLTKIEALLTHPIPTKKTEEVPHSSSAKEPLPSPETIITIDKNEPLSKYETVNLPDEININFVDR